MIARLQEDVVSFPEVKVEEPTYDSIIHEFEKFSGFKPMYERIVAICQEYQRIYKINTPKMGDVCNVFKEFEMMVDLHERLLYPYFDVLRDKQEKHALFDGSIYGVIQVLQRSSDKIRSILNLKLWELEIKSCDSFQSFTELLKELSPKVLAYIDIHDRFVYPEAISLEDAE